jgi:uncharacterized protein (TIGR03067 family)
MLRLLLPIVLGAFTFADDDWKPTDAELQCAHEMLAGSWQFVSISDRGENLGPKLVESRFARDGVVVFANRKLTIVNPVTGETRAATYRIDPAKTPRRIDMITRDDRILRGIYKFEGDGLVLCLQPDDSKSLPEDFSVPEGSDLMLIRLKAMPTSEGSVAKPAAASASRTVASGRIVEPVRDRGPSESELRRAHELLAGDWEILSMVDDGETLGPELIRTKFAENGRVQIGTRKLAIISPKGGDRRLSTIHIDPSKTPSEVDVTTQFDEVLKGIYQFNGDKLLVCLAKRDDDDRPTTFAAPTGSSDLLFTLKLAAPQESKPAPAAASVRPTAKVADAATTDERVRERIVGAWSFNDIQGNLTLVFRKDGTFAATRTWRSGLKRLFEGNTTTSDGRWNYSRGMLDAYITSSMDPKLLARDYNFAVQSIGDDSMVVKTLFGQLRTAKRLR